MPNKTRVHKNNTIKRRITGFLKSLQVYHDSDEETIDLYVETYEFYQRMLAEVSEGDLLIEFTNKAGATNLVKNPLAIEITKTVQVLNNLLKSLGLTPVQRKALLSPADGDEFERFEDSD